jgi:epoxyqueuosine reductase QueG
MAEISSESVKEMAINAGASVVGIAAAGDLDSSAEGYRPSDQLEGCRSIIVLGSPAPRDVFEMSVDEYTAHRNEIVSRMTEIAKAVAKQIMKSGNKAKAVSSIGGKYVEGKYFGPISLKHAAVSAGLGQINRNYYLTNSQYGNLLWLSAVLTDADLIPDKKVEYNLCENCNICVEACPVGALDDPTAFGRTKCGNYSFKLSNKRFEIRCHRCRQVCPHRFGF